MGESVGFSSVVKTERFVCVSKGKDGWRGVRKVWDLLKGSFEIYGEDWFPHPRIGFWEGGGDLATGDDEVARVVGRERECRGGTWGERTGTREERKGTASWRRKEEEGVDFGGRRRSYGDEKGDREVVWWRSTASG